jgi:hypothetical protein
MTSEDDSSLSEEELDEIASRVAEQLGGAADGDDEADTDEIEVHVEDDAERTDDTDPDQDPGSDQDADDHEGAHRSEREAREDAQRKAREKREEAQRKAREARETASGLENLGDRIEAAVEDQLEHVGEHLERSLEAGLGDPPEPSAPGVVIGPDDAREKAVYKTQLQKGGRVAVPDTEIEALDLEPGDTLQVVLYPLD